MSRTVEQAGRALLAVGGLVRRAEVSAGRAHAAPDRRPGGGRVLPGPLVLRQGGALHARGELHRVVFVEGVRPGRHHHLGAAADRLSERRRGPAGVRAARLPARRGVLLVHVLADPGALPVRPRACWSRCTGRRRPASVTRSRRGRTSRPTRSGAAATSRPGARAVWCGSSWDEALEIVAAAHVHAIKEYGPDRVAGFSPIPAMSMVSHAVGARFISLIGGSMLSFYDWYADLPVASPQMFGDQTDVPESGDWWDASYLMMWGSNVPVTRTPDAHWMAEARYRGQKVVVVVAGLRRQREVRRRVAAGPAGHRRRAGDGDGPRHPQGVLRRPDHAAVRRLRVALHRPAVPGHAGAGRRWRLPAGQVRHRRRPRARPTREAAFRPVLWDDRHRRAGGAQRVARAPVRRGRRRQVEPRPRRASPRG